MPPAFMRERIVFLRYLRACYRFLCRWLGGWTGLLGLFLIVTLSGCPGYSDRVVFILEEDGNFPCLGVIRWQFTVKDDTGAVAFQQSTFAKGAAQGQLFWDQESKSNKCRFGDTISFKSALPFGGRRVFEAVGYDSANQTVAVGSSTPIDFEPKQLSDGANGLFVNVELKRVQGVTRGTLVLLWTQLPVGTTGLQLVLKAHAESGQNLKERSIPIRLTQDSPTFAIVSGIASATGRKFTVNALSGQQILKTSSEQTFDIQASVPGKIVSLSRISF
ncbi:MAG TPA: hypothetical protein DCE42_22480 [Myxococcales bacterium]|nr:hypothetical protein [Myxococcales bacterium]